MLISYTDIKKYKSISKHLDSASALDGFIQEAEEFDVRPFLGDSLYIDLVADFEASPSLTKYADLMNGSDFTYGTLTSRHEGLKAVLIYYAYARYLPNSNITATASGLVNKDNDFSTAISSKVMQGLVDRARSGAMVYQGRVESYLWANRSTIPLWRGGINKRKGKTRISAVGGNSAHHSRLSAHPRCGCGNASCYGFCGWEPIF